MYKFSFNLITNAYIWNYLKRIVPLILPIALIYQLDTNIQCPVPFSENTSLLVTTADVIGTSKVTNMGPDSTTEISYSSSTSENTTETSSMTVATSEVDDSSTTDNLSTAEMSTTIDDTGTIRTTNNISNVTITTAVGTYISSIGSTFVGVPSDTSSSATLITEENTHISISESSTSDVTSILFSETLASTGFDLTTLTEESTGEATSTKITTQQYSSISNSVSSFLSTTTEPSTVNVSDGLSSHGEMKIASSTFSEGLFCKIVFNIPYMKKYKY